MSEPKGRAASLKRVVPGVLRWEVFDDRIGALSEAYAVAAQGEAVLIDPLPLEERAAAALERRGPVAAIVLTGSCHQRSAWRYRRRFGAKVLAPHAAEGLDEEPDAVYRSGARLPAGLRAIRTPGPAMAHYSLLSPLAGGVLFCADLLVSTGRGRLDFVPGAYQDDPLLTRRSVRRLLDLKFRTLCFAHGRPLIRRARRAIREALEKDSA